MKIFLFLFFALIVQNVLVYAGMLISIFHGQSWFIFKKKKKMNLTLYYYIIIAIIVPVSPNSLISCSTNYGDCENLLHGGEYLNINIIKIIKQLVTK